MPNHRIRSHRHWRSANLWLALALGCLTSPGAHAWGPDGHRIVGELAQRQLSPAARTEVEHLLAAEPEPTLAGSANWADEVRDLPAYRDAGPLHYVNFAPGSCRYQVRRDCPAGRCVVRAIGDYAHVLGDRDRSLAVRREALKWIVHLVGDIHQPLHATNTDDKGGNDFQVFYAGRNSNLHAIWDTAILELPGRPWRVYADLLATLPVEGKANWSASAPRAWAEESCRLIEAADIYPARPGRLGRAYAARHLPLIERQLALAGARLASLLNEVLR